MNATEGTKVESLSLAFALEDTFPKQYSELNRNKIARNAASSWTQSGHLVGRAQKARQHLKPSVVAVALALFIGNLGGYAGATVFSSPWCRLVDLNADSAKAMGFEAHRAGLLNLRIAADVVELEFPQFSAFQGLPS